MEKSRGLIRIPLLTATGMLNVTDVESLVLYRVFYHLKKKFPLANKATEAKEGGGV
jgi:hypothetical protein